MISLQMLKRKIKRGGGGCGREADSSDEVGKGEALEEKQMR